MHVPVLEKEVLNYLKVESNQNFVDCTVGEAGHASTILSQNGPEGKVLGIDRDPSLIRKLKDKNFSDRLKLIQGNFSRLDRLVERLNFDHVHGILFDFGVCSYHFERSGKGFTFQKKEPLDMRFNSSQETTAKKIINGESEEKLKKILSEYGEEKYAEDIAKLIVERREGKTIDDTDQLLEIIKEATPERYQHRRKHFAAQTFQALRIAVNHELENIEEGLRKSLRVVEPEGRIVAISFHSLEDRTVKQFFKKREERKELKILTKKPVTPTSEEINKNPKSRSAKLRAAQKI